MLHKAVWSPNPSTQVEPLDSLGDRRAFVYTCSYDWCFPTSPLSRFSRSTFGYLRSMQSRHGVWHENKQISLDDVLGNFKLDRQGKPMWASQLVRHIHKNGLATTLTVST